MSDLRERVRAIVSRLTVVRENVDPATDEILSLVSASRPEPECTCVNYYASLHCPVHGIPDPAPAADVVERVAQEIADCLDTVANVAQIATEKQRLATARPYARSVVSLLNAGPLRDLASEADWVILHAQPGPSSNANGEKLWYERRDQLHVKCAALALPTKGDPHE